MNKWLKRNKKWLMVVGGSFLMVAFLLPQTINQLAGDPNKLVYATLDGSKVRGLEYHLYQKQYEALKAFPFTNAAFKNLGVEQFEHYMLLTKQAERLGVIGGRADAQGFLDDIAPGSGAQEASNQDMNSGDTARLQRAFKAMQGDPEARQYYVKYAKETFVPGLSRAAAGKAGLTEEQWDHTLASFVGMLRMVEGYLQSARVSDRRALQQARKLAEAATIDYAIVSSDRLADKVPAPTDAEMTAHYEKYKGVEPGTGEHGIGYRMGDRVRVEWVQINKARVAEAIRLNDAHVRERWNQSNKGGTQAQFDAAKPEFEKTLRRQYADDLLRIADGRFREIAAEANRKFQLEGRWRVVPPNWRESTMTLESLAKAVEAAVKTETAAPDDRERWQSPVDITGAAVVFAESALQAETDLRKLDGIGSSSLQRGNERTPFALLALAVRDLKPDTAFPLQIGVIPVFDRSLSDNDGNLYYCRLTAARPAGEPEGLGEVRGRVFSDLKKLAAYEMLKADLNPAVEAASTSGLDGVVSRYPVATALDPNMSLPTLPVEIRRGARVTRDRFQFQSDNDALNIAEFRDAVITKAQTLDTRTLASSLPGPMRTLGVALPKYMSVVVARIEFSEPVTREFLRQSDPGISGRVISEEMPVRDGKTPLLANSPYSFEELRKRLVYVPTRGEEAKN